MPYRGSERHGDQKNQQQGKPAGMTGTLLIFKEIAGAFAVGIRLDSEAQE
jgi:hypothetical protein